MLILLPPSEGKSTPDSGDTLKLDGLSFSHELGPIRRSLISSADQEKLCSPVSEIYSGVLYQALSWGTLPKAAQKRGSTSLVIISALFGALRMHDVIPFYKAKMKTSLWKGALASVLDSLDPELIVDCRSSTYSGVWVPDPSKTVVVRVYKVEGKNRSVITHMSKKYRGELTRYLLLDPVTPRTPAELKEAASKHFECELVANVGTEPWKLDLLITL